MVTLRSDSADMERPHSRPRMPPHSSSRPPSVNNSTNLPPPLPARTATTSRRGGRTRARSPAVSSGASSRMMGDENPSSAAAAAAAAAKAFSSASSRASVASAGERGRDDRSTGGSSYGPPPGYEGGYPPHKWPGYDPSKRGAARMHYPPRYGPPPGYGGGGGAYPPPHDYDRRYRGEHGPPPPRGPHHPHAPPPPPHEGGGHPRSSSRYPVDYRYHSRGAGPTTPPKGSRGGTSLVLGGATPIHVPKTAAPPAGPPERPTRASAASVFRGRSSAAADAPPPLDDEPSKILMSLRTPSTSFEEKKEGDGSAGLSLSPDDPPKILSSTQQQRAVDMFEKSPDGTKSTTHIDMNASFTLFNQSFDSFGESYFNVESTLHNTDSFGMSRTGSAGQNSDEPPPPALQPALSNTGLQVNLSSTMLGPSPSGHLTIGYSPVNSFGNPAQSPKRSGSGSMMVLGGPEHRSSSPTQVLGMYRSYSGSASRGPPSGPPPGPPPGPPAPLAEDAPPYRGGNYPPNPYRPPPPPHHYDHYGRHPQHPPHDGPVHSDHIPPFYSFLRKYRGAFTACGFLLPGLKAALLEAPGNPDPYAPPAYGEQPMPQDIEIARRRVESSVCAFGGNHGDSPSHVTSRTKDKAETTSIFRDQDDGGTHKESATVTPSSSVASPPRNYSRARAKYEEVLPGRYYENESRLSWEFEENPPVDVSDEESSEKDNENGAGDASKKNKEKNADGSKPSDDDKPTAPSPQPKMKYRCKLCGQPKQNHTCPYQQSLARSIGVMVYPAVNAFTAAEPGTIAPALADMNNFIDVKDPNSPAMGEPQPRPTPERSSRLGTSPTNSVASPKHVTPEIMRSSPSPPHPSPAQTPKIQNRKTDKEKRGTKRSYGGNMKGSADDQGDLLFVESMEIKPQQLLTVTPMSSLSHSDAYTYATLPLPYAQRKRLSDNLFSLSNEVPHLTDECAVVLREAREKDMWDLAVAELITQVLVVTRCSDGDHRFEGLAQYLLTLGISC